MGIIVWSVCGVRVGAVAKFLRPGRAPGREQWDEPPQYGGSPAERWAGTGAGAVWTG